MSCLKIFSYMLLVFVWNVWFCTVSNFYHAHDMSIIYCSGDGFLFVCLSCWVALISIWWTKNGNTRQYRNKTVRVGCTERTLVVSFIICLCCVVPVSVRYRSYERTAKWETKSDFQRGHIVGAHLAGASVTKTATLLHVTRAAVSKVMTTYRNHGRTSSVKRNSGRKPNLSERDRCTLKRIMSVSHRTATAKVTAELNIHLEDCFHKNSLTRASEIQYPW